MVSVLKSHTAKERQSQDLDTECPIFKVLDHRFQKLVFGLLGGNILKIQIPGSTPELIQWARVQAEESIFHKHSR